jgi:hypothetical protein
MGAKVGSRKGTLNTTFLHGMTRVGDAGERQTQAVRCVTFRARFGSSFVTLEKNYLIAGLWGRIVCG